MLVASAVASDLGRGSPISELSGQFSLIPDPNPAQIDQSAQATREIESHSQPSSKFPVDANGAPIPLERQQPQRILGFMPNFRSVSGGSKPPPPGWKYNFTVATHQATDYSTFIFLGLTSLTAEGMNMHPSLGKGVGGFYAYTWRGFLDKTDNTYLSAWLLPSSCMKIPAFTRLAPVTESQSAVSTS